jgi:hypothetical protein
VAKSEDELYRLPPAEFVAARDELARELKAEGNTGAASHVKGLRRPTVSAWALNQLRDRAADDLAELEALQKQVRGRKKPDLKAVLATRRALLPRLASAAYAALEEGGHNPGPQQQDITDTLEAAVVDPEVLGLLRAGRLIGPADPPGLEALGTLR